MPRSSLVKHEQSTVRKNKDISAKMEGDVDSYSEGRLVSKGRGRMPGLDLGSEDDFDFSGILSASVKERFENIVDCQSHFGARRLIDESGKHLNEGR